MELAAAVLRAKVGLEKGVTPESVQRAQRELEGIRDTPRGRCCTERCHRNNRDTSQVGGTFSAVVFLVSCLLLAQNTKLIMESARIYIK